MTVRVSIMLVVDSTGRWCGHGWTGHDERHAFALAKDTDGFGVGSAVVQEFVLSADVPVPPLAPPQIEAAASPKTPAQLEAGSLVRRMVTCMNAGKKPPKGHRISDIVNDMERWIRDETSSKKESTDAPQ